MKKKFYLLLMMAIVFALLNAQAQEEKSVKKTSDVTFLVGMHCQSCKDRIEKNIPFEKGVKDLKVDLEKKEVTIIFNPQKTTIEKLKKAVIELGYTCEQKEVQKVEKKDQKL
jgi:mercuric ion binding protein